MIGESVQPDLGHLDPGLDGPPVGILRVLDQAGGGETLTINWPNLPSITWVRSILTSVSVSAAASTGMVLLKTCRPGTAG